MSQAGFRVGAAVIDRLPIRVLFVVLPNSLVLDWAGPAEALRTANRLLAEQGRAMRFLLEFVGPVADPVTSVGVGLRDIRPLPVSLGAVPGQTVWVVLVGQPGSRFDLDSAAARATRRWLSGLRPAVGQLELVTVCAGAVLAAHAGLLAGREATTHHHHLDELRQADPACKVVANRVFVIDGPIYSSAGVTTGIDLMLHRIAETCGAVLAAEVAQSMVVALRRGPGDPELSPFLCHRNHLHPALHRLQDAIGRTPRDAWPMAEMARVACVSPRHLTRLFREHAGIAPFRYLRQIRLAVARAALQAGLPVGRAAELAGFGSDTQLRRAWHQLGAPGTPSSPG